MNIRGEHAGMQVPNPMTVNGNDFSHKRSDDSSLVGMANSDLDKENGRTAFRRKGQCVEILRRKVSTSVRLLYMPQQDYTAMPVCPDALQPVFFSLLQPHTPGTRLLLRLRESKIGEEKARQP